MLNAACCQPWGGPTAYDLSFWHLLCGHLFHNWAPAWPLTLPDRCNTLQSTVCEIQLCLFGGSPVVPLGLGEACVFASQSFPIIQVPSLQNFTLPTAPHSASIISAASVLLHHSCSPSTRSPHFRRILLQSVLSHLPACTQPGSGICSYTNSSSTTNSRSSAPRVAGLQGCC